MSDHVLLSKLNDFVKRHKIRGLSCNKFNITRARVLGSFYHMTLRLL